MLLVLFCIAAANTFKLGYLLAVASRIHAAPLGGLEGLGCGSGLCLVRRFYALDLRGLHRALDLHGLHHALDFHGLHSFIW